MVVVAIVVVLWICRYLAFDCEPKPKLRAPIEVKVMSTISFWNEAKKMSDKKARWNKPK